MSTSATLAQHATTLRKHPRIASAEVRDGVLYVRARDSEERAIATKEQLDALLRRLGK